MARSIADIKRTMTDAFMADAVIRNKYGFAEDETFDDAFSVVSLESILFYIVAACCHVLEVLFDRFTADVDGQVRSAIVASVPWYHRLALDFQYGDALVYDEKTCQYVYPHEVSKKRLVKYVAVRDRGNSIEMLVSADKNGLPVPLSKDVQTAFEEYMNRVKIAGVVMAIKSLPADQLQIDATIRIDPMMLRSNGAQISSGQYPVVEAIKAYLQSIVYGGTFNKTKLVDAIQLAEGVVDIELGACKYSDDGGKTWKLIAGNNYTSVGGSFIATGLENSLRYVV